MANDEVFLRAIGENPTDETNRLVYADWLDERGDVRGEFLRVQAALREEQADEVRYRELCRRERELLAELDPAWIQRVRQYTTAAPCRDIAELVPELAPYRRTTTRLHPHRAVEPLPTWISKIGGRFHWPAEEAWPSCPECEVDLAPILQLHRNYVPDIEYPSGTDLLQLFWCPDEEAHDYQPSAHVWWRDSAAIDMTRSDDPDLSRFPRRSEHQGFIPFECSVYPEEVVEYPIGDDLYYIAGDEVGGRIQSVLDALELDQVGPPETQTASDSEAGDHSPLPFSELSECPGSKVGGKPGFIENGWPFDHLVTLATWECDPTRFRRWLALEDQRILTELEKPLAWDDLFPEGSPEVHNLQRVLGMQLGRTQNAHVYVCRKAAGWPVHTDISD